MLKKLIGRQGKIKQKTKQREQTEKKDSKCRPNISLISLNVNGLTTPNKRDSQKGLKT